jgi:hypothetical protein
MGLFTKRLAKMLNPDRETYLADYSKRCDQCVVKQLDESVPVSTRFIIDDLQDLLEGLEDQAFIAGGFAAYIAGLSNTYGDIDVFCMTREAYTELLGRVDKRVVTKLANMVVKCLHRNLDIDIICAFEDNQNADPEDLFPMFDLNWCMCAIDIGTMQVVHHPDAELVIPRGNQPVIRDSVYIEKIEERLAKYYSRRYNPCTDKQFREAHKILKAFLQAAQTPTPTQTEKLYNDLGY